MERTGSARVPTATTAEERKTVDQAEEDRGGTPRTEVAPFTTEQETAAGRKPTEFDALNLPEAVLAGIHEAGFVQMTPIQRGALPILLAGQDLCGQAQTGTGKTAAFLIALFTKLLDQVNARHRAPLGLILAPTRELALQIYQEGMALGAHTGLRLAAIYGGEGYAQQESRLRSGVDIVVGTPGRLLDFARRRILDVSRIRFLVIDESDRLLDMGFWDELQDILDRLPAPEDRQSMLFSATLDPRTKGLASSYMNHPQDVAVKPEQVTPDGIDQMIYHVDRDRKFDLLLGIFSREEVPKGLIFANQKITVTWLAKKLNQHGYEAELLTGDLPQKERTHVLDRFRRGESSLLVASDVASRGLHIDDVTHIINYDLPQDPEDYVHRIGRTARAGKRGKAYTLACDEYCESLPEIEDLLGEKIPYEIPYDQDYGKDKTPRFTIREMLRQEGHRASEPRHAGPRHAYGRPPVTAGRPVTDRISRSVAPGIVMPLPTTGLRRVRKHRPKRIAWAR
jgi:ATP-dependent RNA helicase RhlB